MTTALEKVLAAAGGPAPQPEDMAAELVLAALTGAQELTELLLADSEDDDEDEDEDKGGGGHASHPTYKKLVSKVGPARAAKMCAMADKRVAATSLARSVTVALSGLTVSTGDWVEKTSLDRHVLALAGKTSEGGPSKPYGNVTYADPGHQADGKARYPVDTPEHVRAAWSYINHPKNAGKYKSEHLASIKSKIKSAAKKHGIDIGGGGSDEEKVAASYVALAAKKPPVPLQAMHHGPFNGVHSHGHSAIDVHDHEHAHNNDSMHDRHPHGNVPPQFAEHEY
jgi:Family of unknown function (DUF6582)